MENRPKLSSFVCVRSKKKRVAPRDLGAAIADPELSDISSTSDSANISFLKDSTWKPRPTRAQRLCCVCRQFCRLKMCKICKRPCHPKCGRSNPGAKDPILSPQGPPVTCVDCVAREQPGGDAVPTESTPGPSEQRSEESEEDFGDISGFSGSFKDLDINEIMGREPASQLETPIRASVFLDSEAAEESNEQVDESTGESREESSCSDEAADDNDTASSPEDDSHAETSDQAQGQDAVDIEEAAQATPVPESSTPVPESSRGRRSYSPLTAIRVRGPMRRSERLAANIRTLLPPDNSDDDMEDWEAELLAEGGTSDEEAEEARPPTPVQTRKKAKRSAAMQTELECTQTWVCSDLPSSEQVDLEEMVSSKLRLKEPLANASKMTPARFFFLYWDSDLLTWIVNQSQLYHTQRGLRCPLMRLEHLTKFLGFLLYSGCVPLPGKAYYWKHGTRQETVASNFTVLEMRLVKAQIHFSDNALQPCTSSGSGSTNNFSKIEELVSRVNTKFSGLVVQENCVAIDEQMTLYKGSKAPAGLKQYLPSKPTPHGFKNWARGGVSGYIYEIVFYTGKKPQLPQSRRSSRISTPGEDTDDAQEAPLLKTAQVVLDLVKDMPAGSYIYFDNLFATQTLVKELIKRGLHFVCTFRPNRLKDCPLTALKVFEKRPRGSHEAFFNSQDKYEVVAWADTKRVLVASDFVGVQPQKRVSRWCKTTKKYVEIDQPAVIRTYNTFMGGVDLADMLAAMHTCPFRWRKWFMRIFCRLVDTSLANAWLIYRSQVLKVKLH